MTSRRLGPPVTTALLALALLLLVFSPAALVAPASADDGGNGGDVGDGGGGGGLGTGQAVPPPIHSEYEQPPTVIGKRRIGTSVQDRPIRAFHLGNPDAKRTAVVLGSMHGDEQAGMEVVDALLDGDPIRRVNLWVVPTMNPDGVAVDDRQNAHGVDLNRNFGHDWAPLTGEYYSGTKAFSEPESRAIRRFLDRVDPMFVVSFHQPLYGVGRAGERRPFVKRLSKGLDLPVKAFNCSGACHGTMTAWFNATHTGTAVTVEFGSSPSRAYLRGTAANGTLAAVLGRH
jgi:predicted deacylase